MRKNILTVALSIAVLAGCAGSRFSFQEARRVQVGWTTDQLQESLGRPYMVTSRQDEEIWIWSFANGLTGATRSISFIVKDGKVVGTPKIPDHF